MVLANGYSAKAFDRGSMRTIAAAIGELTPRDRRAATTAVR